MNSIQLSTATAQAARTALLPVTPLPRTSLPGGFTAAALEHFQARTHVLVDAHLNAALTRCAAIASFADRVCYIDADTAAAIEEAARDV
ncbi:hypothetical protein [Corynebacterium lipophiloflavum]|uniref:Uncharacterized protein n=1 Tax=Corynebacterium lipophiloflavum (strain ATCC 700352 / DSM 44291 / CCUG 37336 / JCM 10383 / DMMZ 1944) TaxID=525263 RepID=C0XNY6_CORLD|nr:hypothetical protein [Corynebacterium lipophiloflavum]EEI18040.1 hypothetical protein HMPREF0298_0156 [Corynebacterium lipophiloflavum DSM 44291]